MQIPTNHINSPFHGEEEPPQRIIDLTVGLCPEKLGRRDAGYLFEEAGEVVWKLEAKQQCGFADVVAVHQEALALFYRSLRKTICLDLVQLYGLDLVQLYGLDLVHHLCPRRAYGPLSLDLVQGIKLDLVQSWCISHTNLVSSLRPSWERDSSSTGRPPGLRRDGHDP